MGYSTRQREVLLDFLVKNHNKHFVTNEIVEELKNQGISQSSIYRNLQRLEKEGQVIRTALLGSREFTYQFRKDTVCKNTIHLTCLCCGKNFHLAKNFVDNIVNEIFIGNKFSVDCSKTIVYGTCEKCK
ncbi:MAG: Fur family transcriptional regulator [Lachnospirales bacterium]